MTQDSDSRAQLYRGYVAWKNWDGSANEDLKERREVSMLAAEASRAGLRPGGQVLEIGFGSGIFLDWCRAHGHPVVGLELIPELVERARAKGHEAILTDAPPEEMDRRFDLIAAFDVFEHLTTDELGRWLAFCREHLAPAGRIVARFPNGGSPFGNRVQSGDLTHRSTLSGGSIDQLARWHGLRLVAQYNAARPTDGSRSALTRWMAYRTRDLIEIAIGALYYGYRLPLDPNLTVVLSPRDDA